MEKFHLAFPECIEGNGCQTHPVFREWWIDSLRWLILSFVKWSLVLSGSLTMLEMVPYVKDWCYDHARGVSPCHWLVRSSFWPCVGSLGQRFFRMHACSGLYIYFIYFCFSSFFQGWTLRMLWYHLEQPWRVTPEM